MPAGGHARAEEVVVRDVGEFAGMDEGWVGVGGWAGFGEVEGCWDRGGGEPVGGEGWLGQQARALELFCVGDGGDFVGDACLAGREPGEGGAEVGFAERAHAPAVLGGEGQGGWVGGLVVGEAVWGDGADVFWCGFVGASTREYVAWHGQFAFRASRDDQALLVAGWDVDVSGGFRRDCCARGCGGQEAARAVADADMAAEGAD